MPFAFSEIFYHIVWRIAPASSPISSPTRRLIRTFLEDSGERFGCEPIAVSVLENHIHILVQILPGIAPGLLASLLMEEIDHYLAKALAMKNPPQWDDGYGIVSISKAHIKIVAEYVRNQESRHKQGKTNSTLERMRQ